MSAAVLNLLRISVGMLLLGLTLFVLRGTPWPTWIAPGAVGLLALSGLIGFVFGDANYFRALLILGPGRTALLASTSPVFTALIAWPLLHEAPGRLALLGMALTLGGVFWVLWERDKVTKQHVEGSIAIGVVCGVLAALGQSVGYVISKLALDTGVDALSATVVRITAAAIAIWLIAFFQGNAARVGPALRDRRATAFMVGGAVFGPFLGVLLSLQAIRFIPAGVAASIVAFYPIFAMLIAARLHGEKLKPRSLAGATVAAVGVVVLFLR